MFRQLKPVIINKTALSSHSIHQLSSISISPSHLRILVEKCTFMKQLKQLHALMILTACTPFGASRLLSFYALSTSGDLGYALKILDTHCDPNPFMWNTLIRAHPDPSQAVFLYVKMRRRGFPPNNYTFPFLIKACAKICSHKTFQQPHVHVLKFGFSTDMYVLNRLILGYSKYNEMNDALQVFDESPERDLTLWTTIICGYAQNMLPQKALLMFDEMLGLGFEPRAVTLSSVLSACASSGCLEIGERIHRFMKGKGGEFGVIFGSALVNMYAKNGVLEMAQKVFDGMRERNIATWNALICGFALQGRANEAIDLFQRLTKEEQIVPNSITFVGVLSACCIAGLVDRGHKFFNSMRTDYGIKPRLEHYSCMVDLLGRNGMVEVAEELIEQMNCKVDVVILSALLTACRNCGNIEIAERVVKKMDSVDPKNHGGYVVLSNMYAEVGRWEDVERVRVVIRRRKLVISGGWSSVNDSN